MFESRKSNWRRACAFCRCANLRLGEEVQLWQTQVPCIRWRQAGELDWSQILSLLEVLLKMMLVTIDLGIFLKDCRWNTFPTLLRNNWDLQKTEKNPIWLSEQRSLGEVNASTSRIQIWVLLCEFACTSPNITGRPWCRSSSSMATGTTEPMGMARLGCASKSTRRTSLAGCMVWAPV
eukprot:symbB.v1.2.013344.t1/scaffold917.1/size152311/8